MLKFLTLAMGFSAILVGAQSEAAIGQLLSEQTAPISSFNQVDLVCYMQTSDGRTVNLSSICGSNVSNPRALAAMAADNAPPGTYTNLGNLDIYGRGPGAPPCYGLDNQGNPCPASR